MNALTPNPLMLLNNPYHRDEISELPDLSHDFLKPDHLNRYNPLTDENFDEFCYYDINIDDPSKNLYHYACDPIDNFQSPYPDSDQVGTHHSNLHLIGKR
jgi:hypothetical protein